MPLTQDFRSAQRVLHALAEKPTERQAEELIPQKVEEAHGPVLHRINQAYSVDKFSLAGTPRGVKSLQILWRNREVGVENHEQFAGGFGKSQAHGISFSFAGLMKQFDAAFRPRLYLPFYGFIRVVVGMTFDKNQFGACAKSRHFFENSPNISRFIASRHNDAHNRLAVPWRLRKRAGHKKICDAHPTEQF